MSAVNNIATLDNLSKYRVVLLPVAIGICVWLLFYHINGKSDPQSFNNYWMYGYAIFVVSSFFATLYTEISPVVFSVAIAFTQILLGIFILQGDLNQLPIGVIAHLFLFSPIILSSYFGAWLRKRHDRGTKGST